MTGESRPPPTSHPVPFLERHKDPSGRPDETVAVALAYDPAAGDEAPRVVASGKGYVAEQILELAFAHGVKVRQDADLVHLLAAVDLDSEIPIEAFIAVAEILAHVYRANGQAVPTASAATTTAGAGATATSDAVSPTTRAPTAMASGSPLPDDASSGPPSSIRPQEPS